MSDVTLRAFPACLVAAMAFFTAVTTVRSAWTVAAVAFAALMWILAAVSVALVHKPVRSGPGSSAMHWWPDPDTDQSTGSHP
jgi:hypothetical protein